MPTNPHNPDESPPRRMRMPRAKPLWVAIAIVVALGLAGGAATLADFDDSAPPVASSDQDAPVVPSETPDAEEAIGPTVFDDPGAFEGQTLDLWAKVVEVVDLNSFRVVNEQETDASLLVVYPGDPPVTEGTEVRLEGVVIPFVNIQVNEQLGIAIDESTYQASEDDHALVATKVTIEGGREAEVAAEPPAAETVAAASVAAAPPPITAASSTATAPAPASGSSSGSTGGGGNGSSSGGGSSGGSGSSGGGTAGATKERNEVTYSGEETSGQYGDVSSFEATMVDENGNPLEGEKVTFILDPGESSRKFRATTDQDGIATATEELTEAPGRYRLIAKHKARNTRNATDKITFVIEREDSALDLTAERNHGEGGNGNGQGNGNNGSNGNGNNGTTLTAALTDPDGSYQISARTVEFFADGESIGSAVTDESGIATFEAPSHHNKHTTFEAHFVGDDYYLGSADSS